MKILVQNKFDKDLIGVCNALRLNHEVQLWDHNTQEITDVDLDVDLAIFSDTSDVGTKTMNAVKKKTDVLFLKCDPPSFLKRRCSVIKSVPVCADHLRYPPAYFNKNYACDIVYFNLFNSPNLTIFEKIPNKYTFRIIGAPIQSLHYIGGELTPNEVSQFCKSAKVCIDIGFQTAPDLAKIGCNVITDMENEIGVPVYNLENLTDILDVAINGKQPVLNPYDSKIITYEGFLKILFKTIEEDK